MSYDPAFTNTASCRSRITYIDGDKGILRYRGYPIEELAENSNYLETAYLIVKGELPDRQHYERWEAQHQDPHDGAREYQEVHGGLRYDAHPMGMLVGTVGALSTFYPDANDITNLESRRLQTRRLIGKVPTLAAFAFRHTRGLPYVYPDNELSYTGNFLSMLFRMTERDYKPNPILERALDVLFILHADHEQNCSTNAMRSVGSSQVDPYSARPPLPPRSTVRCTAAPTRQVIRMLMEIGSAEERSVDHQEGQGGRGRLMGFGHRVYKNYDPRAKIVKRIAYEVFEVTGRNPLIDIALELERIALEDDYFISRKLYPNVDFYSGIIYQAMGFPMTMFPVLFRDPADVGMAARNGPRWTARSRAENSPRSRRCVSRSISALTLVRYFQQRCAAAVGDCAIPGWPRRNSLL
jgi:citrate synthase